MKLIGHMSGHNHLYPIIQKLGYKIHHHPENANKLEKVKAYSDRNLPSSIKRISFTLKREFFKLKSTGI